MTNDELLKKALKLDDINQPMTGEQQQRLVEDLNKLKSQHFDELAKSQELIRNLDLKSLVEKAENKRQLIERENAERKAREEAEKELEAQLFFQHLKSRQKHHLSKILTQLYKAIQEASEKGIRKGGIYYDFKEDETLTTALWMTIPVMVQSTVEPLTIDNVFLIVECQWFKHNHEMFVSFEF